jgi:hypothetical protein
VPLSIAAPRSTVCQRWHVQQRSLQATVTVVARQRECVRDHVADIDAEARADSEAEVRPQARTTKCPYHGTVHGNEAMKSGVGGFDIWMRCTIRTLNILLLQVSTTLPQSPQLSRRRSAYTYTMLEKAPNYSHASIFCSRCNGVRFLTSSEFGSAPCSQKINTFGHHHSLVHVHPSRPQLFLMHRIETARLSRGFSTTPPGPPTSTMFPG